MMNLVAAGSCAMSTNNNAYKCCDSTTTHTNFVEYCDAGTHGSTVIGSIGHKCKWDSECSSGHCARTT